MEIRRGAFRNEDAKEWLHRLINSLNERLGWAEEDMVFVFDNARCHVGFDRLIAERASTGLPNPHLLRLGPYSPMLNPIENVWSAVKAHVKANNRPPVVQPPHLGEQRIAYLEGLIGRALSGQTLTTALCANCIQHSGAFVRMAQNGQLMPVGQ